MNAPAPSSVGEAQAVIGHQHIEFGALGQSIGFMLRLSQTRAYDQFFQEFAETDVRPGEFTVIWVLSLNPNLRQGVLARTLNIKPAHMTKLVQRLVRARFVQRTVPPKDRRAVILSLTTAGLAHLERYRARFLAVHQAERAGLSDSELSQLLLLLNKLHFNEPTPCP